MVDSRRSNEEETLLRSKSLNFAHWTFQISCFELTNFGSCFLQYEFWPTNLSFCTNFRPKFSKEQNLLFLSQLLAVKLPRNTLQRMKRDKSLLWGHFKASLQFRRISTLLPEPKCYDLPKRFFLFEGFAVKGHFGYNQLFDRAFPNFRYLCSVNLARFGFVGWGRAKWWHDLAMWPVNYLAR